MVKKEVHELGQMAEAIKAMPQYKELVSKYSLHMEITKRCMSRWGRAPPRARRGASLLSQHTGRVTAARSRVMRLAGLPAQVRGAASGGGVGC